jgi:predicted extracellular nuclease
MINPLGLLNKLLPRRKENYTIAFYNLENMFDTVDDPDTNDDDFLPTAPRKWTIERYHKKLLKLNHTIAQIGLGKSKALPILIGIAEVENEMVVKDLLGKQYLADENYSYVHYDSPDERGIDVALLYKKEFFEVLDSRPIALMLYDAAGRRDYTRDVLYIKGKLLGEIVYVLVNHWPSRRKGENATDEKRMKASQLVLDTVAEIRAKDKKAKIIIMGDFNDGPTNRSVSQFKYFDFYNPMLELQMERQGSLVHYNTKYLFDQVIVSTNFRRKWQKGMVFDSASVYDEEFLKVWRGRDKGKPFRTYQGIKYRGGYSDHFPVYIHIKK